MAAYYNEHDPFAAAWLRELIKAGHIAPGEVDERSIEDVCADDLAGFVQCHFFAGIGVWSHALRLAGWSDNRKIWTASCPCQPFSAAGKGAGFVDERHLWPAFFDLMQQCDPTIAIGEQVASKDGLAWLDLVRADVEGAGRTFAAADLCAAGFGAPHIRQRSFWMAYADRGKPEQSARQGARSAEAQGGRALGQPAGRGNVGGLADHDDHGQRAAGAYGRDKPERHLEPSGAIGRVADSASIRRIGRGPGETSLASGSLERSQRFRDVGGLGHAGSAASERNARTIPRTETRKHGARVGLHGGEPVGSEYAGSSVGGLVADKNGGLDNAAGARHIAPRRRKSRQVESDGSIGGSVPSVGCGLGHNGPPPTNGFWSDADWLGCRDGKWRPVEPGTFPLAHGAPARVGRLRGYGNAIVAPVARGFIESVMDIVND